MMELTERLSTWGKTMGLFSKRIEKQIESYQHELIETHYREVDNMYRQIRGWRHDYRNHIQTMKAYAATENWEAIKSYQIGRAHV